MPHNLMHRSETRAICDTQAHTAVQTRIKNTRRAYTARAQPRMQDRDASGRMAARAARCAGAS